MLTVANVLQTLRDWAPFELAWEKDNIGILVGSASAEVRRALVCLDLTEEVAEEAATLKCDLIVAHHPAIFHPIKSIRLESEQGRILSLCLKSGISVIAVHTNADATLGGLNTALAERLGLTDVVPLASSEVVKQNVVLFTDPAIENGDGFFNELQGLPDTTWTQAQFENGIARIEVLAPHWSGTHIQDTARHEFGEALISSHTARVADTVQGYGIGAVGMLADALPAGEFIDRVKSSLGCGSVRTTPYDSEAEIRKVAVCGGAGSSYIPMAIAAGAQAFVTSDLTYHTFQDYRHSLLLIDAGHYETEHVFIDLCAGVLRSAIEGGQQAIEIITTQTNTNPVRIV